ncbi:MAG: MutS-related protein [Sarcina sp.]
MFSKKNSQKYVQIFWPDGPDKPAPNFKEIRKYYDDFTKGTYGEVDDQSFSDLTLETLYTKMDGTYSSAGQSKLYDLLRNPAYDQKTLDSRSDFMNYFSKNTNDRITLQALFLQLGRDKKFKFLDLITQDFKGNPLKGKLYFLLGKILPALIIVLGFFYHPIWVGILILLILNSLITSIERGYGGEKPYSGIYYTAKLIKCANDISKLKIDILNPYQEKISNVMKNLGPTAKNLTKASTAVGNIEFPILEPVLELVGIMFLNAETAYYNMIDHLNNHKSDLQELYSIIGEIDTLLAVQGYKESSSYETTKPIFTENCDFEIIDGAHPLVEDVVKNSITIDNKGIVLTGTNMSGKSTFLRMLGLNIILAQSFNFVHAKKYKSDFLNFVSSISPEDDINAGKSYYIAEAESVLRIIHALDGKLKVFCAIDEIFRGTNPVERIAASEEILKYIQARNSISIVATHDKELTDLLKDTHDFYHFSESVDQKTGLSFDYKLKKGVLKTRNAIKLLKFIGYPDEIINGAFKSIGKI